jgi:hypothetical protein
VLCSHVVSFLVELSTGQFYNESAKRFPIGLSEGRADESQSKIGAIVELDSM